MSFLPLRRTPCAGLRAAHLLVMVLSSIPSGGCAREQQPVYLDMATTTSVKNSGLLDAILPAFPAARVRVHAAGSGRALEMLADQIVDVAITHAPEAERRYLEKHPQWRYRKFAYNRFVVVGPAEDPAAVRSAEDAVAAFRRVAVSPMPFVSRGDQSGTHERELALWKAAGVRPPPDRLIVSGASMAVALRQADERQAYTLSDEATFRQLGPRLDLVVLLVDDSRLLNTYATVYARDNAIAARFADWLTASDGRARLAGYTIGGVPALTTWPRSCPADRPELLPCPAAPRE